MSEHHIVDGYNVVHKSSLLRPLALQDFEAAREAFIEKLVNYCLATGHRVTVVFDGRDAYARIHEGQSIRGVPGLSAVYSPEHLSADAVIERMVYSARNRLECVVVSNDRGLRDLCRGLGALTMEPDHFIRTIRAHQGDLREGLAHKSRMAAKPALLEDRLDGGSMDRLRALRDQLDTKKGGRGTDVPPVKNHGRNGHAT